MIGGQVLSAVALDCVAHGTWPTPVRVLGVLLVLAGLLLPRLVRRRRAKSDAQLP
ncbi:MULTISPECIES: hypothetical protein [unclassified Streptomyces]|uniref:hypothetical protein n=1 Tax=unclassified Streptomyces TaxID=2593676 RepID=UPI00037D2778|nr:MULTISPECIES: hypothetical protein [unclassified Streptomyces]